MKTILLHVQNDAGVVQRLETALSLARACGAHLDCLQVTQMEAYVAVAPTDNFGGVLSESDAIKASTNEEVQLRLAPHDDCEADQDFDIILIDQPHRPKGNPARRKPKQHPAAGFDQEEFKAVRDRELITA